jgi:hypothetical protein
MFELHGVMMMPEAVMVIMPMIMAVIMAVVMRMVVTMDLVLRLGMRVFHCLQSYGF